MGDNLKPGRGTDTGTSTGTGLEKIAFIIIIIPGQCFACLIDQKMKGYGYVIFFLTPQ